MEGVGQMSAEIRSELIDDLMETYVDWREECIALRNSYERWSNAPAEEREPAFSAYRAALDREEQASVVFAERTESVVREQREPRERREPHTAPEAVLGGVGGRVMTAAESWLRPLSSSD
jgi:hypothetical protein